MTNLVEVGDRFGRRQDVPPVYRINASLYIWRTNFVSQELEELETGQIAHVRNPRSARDTY